MNRRDFFKVTGVVAASTALGTVSATATIKIAKPIAPPKPVKPVKPVEAIRPVDRYLAVYDADGKEWNGDGYKRQPIFFDMTGTDSLALSNTNDVQFGPITSKEPKVASSLGIMDAQGNALYTGPFNVISIVEKGSTFRVLPNNLTITID